MKGQHQQARGAPECDASDDSVLQCEPYRSLWSPSDGCCKRRITPEANHPTDDSVVVGAGLEWGQGQLLRKAVRQLPCGRWTIWARLSRCLSTFKGDVPFRVCQGQPCQQFQSERQWPSW